MGRKRRMVDGCAGAALRSAPANSAKRMPMWGWDCQAYVAACVIAPAPAWGSGTNSQEHSSPGACWGGRASCQHGGSRAGAGSNVGEAGDANGVSWLNVSGNVSPSDGGPVYGRRRPICARAPPKAVLIRAGDYLLAPATTSMLHQRLAQAADDAVRTAGGAGPRTKRRTWPFDGTEHDDTSIRHT
eukprot:s3302_g7.t1